MDILVVFPSDFSFFAGKTCLADVRWNGDYPVGEAGVKELK
jgi:hypothetical protein